MGRTDGLLCPVSAILSYMVVRGSVPGPFFKYQTGCPLTKLFTGKFFKDVGYFIRTLQGTASELELQLLWLDVA